MKQFFLPIVFVFCFLTNIPDVKFVSFWFNFDLIVQSVSKSNFRLCVRAYVAPNGNISLLKDGNILSAYLGFSF
jgi:hypothetical protein